MSSLATDAREMNMRDMIQALTGGRPYVFMIVSFTEKRRTLYEHAAEVAEDELGVACIRADQVPSSGYDLLAKVHLLIQRAELVIADISIMSPNVFYEIGYAVGVQKPPVLLAERAKEIPADLRGLEVVEFDDTMDGSDVFKRDLGDHLRFRMNFEIALLRDMTEAPVPQPSFIVASPKYPGRNCRIKGQVYDRRTFGDNLGILGLIAAFGSMWGQGKGVELVSAQHSPPDLLGRDINLYLIGSRKVNAPAGEMLDRLQEGQKVRWTFGPMSSQTEEKGDWPASLYRLSGRGRELVEGKVERLGEQREQVWTEDYGIVVRAPHPEHPHRIVMIMAGAHSLGSGAACLAATRSSLIQKIRSELPPRVLEDKERAFWVLVKGVVNNCEDFLLDEEGVTVEEVGVYE